MGHEPGEAIDAHLRNRLPEELQAYGPYRQLVRQEGTGSSTLVDLPVQKPNAWGFNTYQATGELKVFANSEHPTPVGLRVN